mgnify:FL=1
MRLNHEKELLQMKKSHWEELKRSSEEILQMKIHHDKAVAKAKEVNEEKLKKHKDEMSPTLVNHEKDQRRLMKRS